MQKVQQGWMVCALAALVTIAPLGCNSGSGGGSAKSYDSPEAVFNGAKEAMKAKDYKGFTQCLTPESQSVMAGVMAMAGNMMKMLGGMAAGFGALAGEGPEAAEAKAKMDEMNKQIAKIDDVLKKHNVTEESMKDLNPMSMGDDPAKAKDALLKIGSGIKDKPAFIGEIMTVLEAMNEGEGESPNPIAGKLENLKTDGDSATGEVVKDDGSKEPIAFKKMDGGWLIDLPLDALQ